MTYRLSALIGLDRPLIINGKKYDIEEKQWIDIIIGYLDKVNDKAKELITKGTHKGKSIYILVRWKKNYKGKWKQDKVWGV